MLGLGPLELGIILVIIVIIFGVGRISKIGGELGKGIKAFKDGLESEDGEEAGGEEEAWGEEKES
jgi:sec-independent protein translocase protein TatA